MFSGLNKNGITAAATWSSQYSSQPAVPGEGEPEPPGIGKSEHSSEMPAWQKAREALEKILPQNGNASTSPSSNGILAPLPQVTVPPNYGYPYGYQQSYYGNYPPYPPPGFPPFPPPVNMPTMTGAQNNANTAKPPPSGYYLPPPPPRPSQPLQTANLYSPNGGQSYGRTGNNQEAKSTRHPVQPECSTLRPIAFQPASNCYNSQKRDEKESLSKANTETISQSSPPLVVNSDKSLIKKPFWLNDKREQSSVLKHSWENEDKNIPPSKKVKSCEKPEKIKEEHNNNASKISPQDWPPSLKDYVQRAFEECETEQHRDITENHLKKMLTRAFKEGTAWGINWEKEALPNLKLEKELRRGKCDERRMNEGSLNLEKKRSRSRSCSSSRSQSSTDLVSSRNDSPENRRHMRRERNKGKVGKRLKKQKSNAKRQNKRKENKENMIVPVDPECEQRKEKRAARFHDNCNSGPGLFNNLVENLNSSLLNINDDEESIDWTKFHIVGTSQEMEKRYFRLTAPPDPCTVRPLDVLRKSLEMVKNDWKANQNYRYACEQLKSIRQDLTVQGIRNDFTVLIYETHARLALEKGDVAEFNQCQSQLKSLYCGCLSGNRNEFTAYRILYLIYTQDTRELTITMSALTVEEKNDLFINHALRMRSAWSLCNYHSFFQLYSTAPNMAGYLLDLFVKREREKAMKTLVKSYRPFLPIAFVQSELAFADEATCREFVASLGLILNADYTKVDCKQSQAVLASAAS